jgi:uncharacterized secreted protein with C-terminal beta-propeller domain
VIASINLGLCGSGLPPSTPKSDSGVFEILIAELGWVATVLKWCAPHPVNGQVLSSYSGAISPDAANPAAMHTKEKYSISEFQVAGFEDSAIVQRNWTFSEEAIHYSQS